MIRRMVNRLRGRLGLTLLALAGLVVVACGALALHDGAGELESASALAAQPRPVKVYRVRRDEGDSPIRYPGVVKASRTAELAFRVGGPLVEVRVSPGDLVEKGDVLMRVDPRDYENAVEGAASRLAAARARLDAMRRGARVQDLKVLEAKIAAAQARFAKARLDLDRAESLYAQKVVSKAELDQAESAEAVAAATLESLKQELSKAKAGSREEDIRATEADIRTLETALASAQDRLSDTTLTAPFRGVVTHQVVENHEMVVSGDEVLGMHDISEIEIEVNVPENEVIAETDWKTYQAQVSLNSLPGRSFVAQLKEFSTDADPLTRTFVLRFAMPQPEGMNVLPGMTAEVSRITEAYDAGETVQVPASAVLSEPRAGSYVWVLEDGSAVPRRRPVQVAGSSGDDYLRVLRGLREGDRVVVGGAHFLSADTPVRVLQ